MGISKLRIKPTDQGLHIFRSAELGEKYNEGVVGTREEIIDALLELSDSDEILAKLQDRKLAKKKEQYEKLQPVGFEYAHQSAKDKWEEFENEDNVEKMQWTHDNVSYNSDHTMNILKLNMKFCEDVTGYGKLCNRILAKTEAESKGYRLGSDYNDCDSQEVRESSDWYRVINVFSNGHGDTVEGVNFFRDMAGCNGLYWTSTEYKDGDKNGFAFCRKLNKNNCHKYGHNIYNDYIVCGFKDYI